MRIAIPIFSTNEKALYLNTAYVNYVEKAGYIPVLLTTANYKKLLDICDSLLLPGGGDIDPIYYGNDNISSNNVCPEKDAFERTLLYEFLLNRKPVFGICRGFQLIVRELLLDKPNTNDFVYYQHINGHSQEVATKTKRKLASHFVMADMGVLYGKSNTVDYMAVNSMHHQAITLAKGSKMHTADNIAIDIEIDNGEISKFMSNIQVKIAAITTFKVPTDEKYILEAIKLPELHVTAVQWHPEEMMDVKLIQHAFGGSYVE